MAQQTSNKTPWLLALTAMGVVYGDIGTSPLYAFRMAFVGLYGLTPSEAHVLATLSALFWAVLLVISLKYMLLVLRFDNDGEGGVLALAAGVHAKAAQHPRVAGFAVALGIFGAALFFGDAVITPAISVLSAIEGLSVVDPALTPLILPLTLLVLGGLFGIQRFGSGTVGRLFGPVMLLWLLTLAALGTASIVQQPSVLKALSPLYAIRFAIESPGAAFLLLSAVFLAMTGGEALYADMGHFGARPIRLAWFRLVWPALMLNYFGQGALLLRDPSAVNHPFYGLAPDALQLPLVVLATLATVIAAQATIAGVFSMTVQAGHLGYLPPFNVKHTSDAERGQVYLPGINWLMLLAVVLLVLGFRSPNAMAAAYGIAVSGAMNITTVLCLTLVFLSFHGTQRLKLMALLLGLWLVELLFFASNATKIIAGGWVPLTLALVLFALMTSWKRGTAAIASQRDACAQTLADFIARPPDVLRVEGMAVYLSSDPTGVPLALQQNIKHYKVLHRQIVLLHVDAQEVPRVPAAERVTVQMRVPDLWCVHLRYGFREEPDVPAALAQAGRAGLAVQLEDTSFFLTRVSALETLADVPRWRRSMFRWLARQGESAAVYYHLPPGRVVELGTQAGV
ncbi:potassium transporter Kup [Craterilacuibacter sinensis]|uniref:Probable potassium transport system protein Kup n=1 Tax=Craterilacuibacter sinensis TaxID=2686017 RepID=A0A845BT61_9NEIS|nr:KUP/HAK/KT family potassium transporter [Craterilacuibacter sinensis]MXR37356.1 potassium transporter Kup [Craterilacuibacter sinensis]